MGVEIGVFDALIETLVELVKRDRWLTWSIRPSSGRITALPEKRGTQIKRPLAVRAAASRRKSMLGATGVLPGPFIRRQRKNRLPAGRAKLLRALLFEMDRYGCPSERQDAPAYWRRPTLQWQPGSKPQQRRTNRSFSSEPLPSCELDWTAHPSVERGASSSVATFTMNARLSADAAGRLAAALMRRRSPSSSPGSGALLLGPAAPCRHWPQAR